MSESESESSQLEPLLERYWGFRAFRPLQREAAQSILDGRDSLVVLPTGGGKSLCYQVPALTRADGLAVVVSPLISLMKDQVDGLVTNGVPAAYYNSSLSSEQQGRVASRLRRGRYRLLYVSPERLAGAGGERFCRLLADCGLRYLAVDEAHCISQWGHDFRPEYRQLGRLREIYPDISLHAFTATATEPVRRDIAEQLRLRDPHVLVGTFDRPNLTFRSQRRKNLYAQIKAAVTRHAGEAGIVYCLSRRNVEGLAARLADDGFRALPYHAGLADELRRRNQDAFINERADIIVATVAFGMGIDRSNVRYVMHAQAPRSLEHYQQEAGRAGRDDLEAECLLIHSPGDFMTWRRMLESGNEWNEHAARNLREMERFAVLTRCRHRALCEHFGESYAKQSCGACDFCLGELEAIDEPVVLAQKILSCVLRLHQRWGVRQVIDVLRGRLSDKVTSRRHHELSTFGLLEDVPAPELRGHLEQLIDQGFLEQEGERYPVVRVTSAGRRLLRADESCRLYRHRSTKRDRRRASADESWEGVDRGLFEALRRLRLATAAEHEVPPYVIFADNTLRQLAKLRPSSPEALLRVHGIGKRKAEAHGRSFLRCIAGYCAEHGLERDVEIECDLGAGRSRRRAGADPAGRSPA
ncbi:MAG: DNA helicase RecQ [bacterium]|nr:DNA helicase RecQ [bacterium]